MLQTGVVPQAALRFAAASGLTFLAGYTLPQFLTALEKPSSAIAFGLLAAGILALVRIGRPAAALVLTFAACMLQVGLSIDRGWPRAAIEPGWLLLAGGGAFLAAVVFDGLASGGIRFGKFVVMGTLFAGIYLALAPLSMLSRPLEHPVGTEILLDAFVGIVIGDAVGLGVELLELFPWLRLGPAPPVG